LNPGHPPRQDGALPLSYVPTSGLSKRRERFLTVKLRYVKQILYLRFCQRMPSAHLKP
jgi:hypothetical protein